MTHIDPHFLPDAEGVCDCDCGECVDFVSSGLNGETSIICVCTECDPIKCGIHEPPR